MISKDIKHCYVKNVVKFICRFLLVLGGLMVKFIYTLNVWLLSDTSFVILELYIVLLRFVIVFLTQYCETTKTTFLFSPLLYSHPPAS